MSYKYISFNLILPNEHRTGKIIFVIVKFQGKTAYMGESEQPIPFLGIDTKIRFNHILTFLNILKNRWLFYRCYSSFKAKFHKLKLDLTQ